MSDDTTKTLDPTIETDELADFFFSDPEAPVPDAPVEPVGETEPAETPDPVE
jgi:hypothetical protein